MLYIVDFFFFHNITGLQLHSSLVHCFICEFAYRYVFSLSLEQQELCRVRLKLLQYSDRLHTYEVRTRVHQQLPHYSDCIGTGFVLVMTLTY